MSNDIHIYLANDGKDKTKEVRRVYRDAPNGTRENPTHIYWQHTHPAICNGMVWELHKKVVTKVSELRKLNDRNYFYDFELPSLENGYRYEFVFNSKIENGGISFNETNFRYLKNPKADFIDEAIEFEIYICDDHEFADTGEYGIIRVENKKFIISHFLKDTIQFKTDVNTELVGNAIGRNHHDTGRRKFFLFTDCEEMEAHYINAEMNNNKPNDKGGREDFPIFSKFLEFEHFIHFERCKKMYFTNIYGKNIWGDGIYTDEGCEDITVIGGLIDKNGRQTIAPCGGKRLWFEGIEGTASTRGYCDVEIPNTSALGYLEDMVVKNGKGTTWLNGLPMGGAGSVERVLFENIELDTKSRTSYVNGEDHRTRKDITFRGIVRSKSHGSDKSINYFLGVENAILEDCHTKISADRSQQILELDSCKNIIVKGDTGENIKYIKLVNTLPGEVKVYGNLKELYFLDENNKQIGTEPIPEATLEDIEKLRPIEPSFKPYMGIGKNGELDEVKEEVEEEETPIEETPIEETPIETEEEALGMIERALEFLKKNDKWFAITIAVIIGLILIL